MKRQRRDRTNGKIGAYIRLSRSETELSLAERKKVIAKRKDEITDFLGTGSHLSMEKKYYIEKHTSNPYEMPELEKCIKWACRKKADIVANKLGTRFKNLRFIDLLYDATQNHQVRFYVCYASTRPIDMSVLLAVSNEHREEVSRHTKQALAKLKEKGIKLGSKDIKELTKHAVKSHTDKRLEFAVKMRPVVEEIQQHGATSLTQIAKALNMREVKTRYKSHKSSWHASSVSNLLKSIKEISQ